MKSPLGGVFPERETSSLKTLRPPLPAQLVKTGALSVEEILNTEYSTDAHFVTYFSKDGEIPRCSQSLLPEIREQGEELWCGWWVLEVDNPQHRPHSSPELAIQKLDATFAVLLPQPHAAYTTRAGWRYLWALDAPLPVDEAAARRVTFASRVLADSDPATLTHDWTRLWRAPKVTRDESAQWMQPWFALRIDLTRPPVCARDYIPAPHVERTYSAAEPLSLPIPSFEDAAELADQLRSPAQAKLLLELRRRAMNRQPLYACAFEGHPACPPDGQGRSNAIQKLAGQACAIWVWLAPQCTPELVYALTYLSVSGFQPDTDPTGPQDWYRHLWETICKYWAREIEKKPATQNSNFLIEEDPLHAANQRVMTQTSKIMEGVEKWNNPEFPAGHGERESWIRNRLLLISKQGGQLHILREDGYYDPESVEFKALVPAIKSRGMGELIRTANPVDGKPFSVDSIVRQYAMPISTKQVYSGVISPSGYPGGILLPPAYGSDAELHLSYFCRKTHLKPEYDPQVDAWLQSLAGPRYEDLVRWLSFVLDFQSPIAALALYGASGAGKKMIQRGLRECIHPGGAANNKAFGRFNGELLKTPFLFIDEGFSAHVPREDRAVQFRLFIDGDGQVIEVKGQTPIRAFIPIRMVFASNNTSFADEIAGGRELTQDDINAISTRTLIIPIQPTAADFLEDKGGLKHTRGWIAPDNTSPAMDGGDLRIARHFLYLYEMRHQFQTGGRLLVEGKEEDRELFKRLQTRSEQGERIFEVIYTMIEQASSRPVKGMVYRTKDECLNRPGPRAREGLYVTSDAVCHQMQQMSHKTGMLAPSTRKMTTLLKSYSLDQSLKIKAGDNTRYTLLDVAMLLRIAEDAGKNTDILQAMVDGIYREPAPLTPVRSMSSLLRSAEEKIN